MRRKLSTHADIKEYLEGIFLGRPGDRYPRIEHARHVSQVILMCAGALFMVADANSIEVSQRVREGVTKDINMLYFTVEGRPFFMCYSDKAIELRNGGRWGEKLERIDNSSTMSFVAMAFLTLRYRQAAA